MTSGIQILNRMIVETFKDHILSSSFGPTGAIYVLRMHEAGNIYRIVGDTVDNDLKFEIFEEAIANPIDPDEIMCCQFPEIHKSSEEEVETWYSLINQWIEEYEHGEQVTIYK